MLGWACWPAGTRAGSPGRAGRGGGDPGGLGHRAYVKSNRDGGGRLWEEEGHRGFGHAGVGGLGASFETWPGCRPALWMGSCSNQCPKGCKSLALS